MIEVEGAEEGAGPSGRTSLSAEGAEEVSSRVSLLSYSVVGTLNDLDLGL